MTGKIKVYLSCHVSHFSALLDPGSTLENQLMLSRSRSIQKPPLHLRESLSMIQDDCC